MGRWLYNKKRTVEDCLSVSVKFLHQHGYFNGGHISGVISWSQAGEKSASIGAAASVGMGNDWVRFNYTHTTNGTGEKEDLNYPVQLVNTPCHWGGRRWWFICPLIINGQPCGRRVGVLYLGGKYFGCRHCNDLTYKSCQDSHKFDSMAKLMNQESGMKITGKDLKWFFERERKLHGG